MAEETQVVETTKEAPVKPVLDSNRPLSSQVKAIESLLKEELKEVKEEDVKPSKDSEEKPSEEVKEEVESEEKPAEQADEESNDEENDYQPAVAEELPEWQRYIYDRLPTIKVLGHTENGQDRVFEVKNAEELPDDFEFTNKKEELKFIQDISAQESNARQLLNEYNTKQQQNQYAEYQRQEAIDISKDISRLQKNGVLPKFKYDENDSRFNDDPAVKEANKIYEIYQETNQRYTREGRAFRISYADAAEKYLYTKSKEVKPEPKKEVNKEVKKAREEVVSPQNQQVGTSPDAFKRGVPSGTSMQDIYRMYKQGRI